jgi:23S rRNA (uracil1939-C5)-methyltransferase
MKITIEKLIAGGNGLGVCDGKRVFVPLSAPGDELEIEIIEDHGSWAEATIKEIITPSECRTEPKCPVFGKCGGCQWQHISYEKQLEWKRNLLIESLSRIGKIESPNVLPTIPSENEWHYRNRIQLHVNSMGNVGFYKPKSKEVVEFEECLIADERINKELNERREEISKRDRGIAIRVEGDEGFAQVNSVQNEQMKKLVVEWLGEVDHKTVLELYAGSGNLTFPIAEIADQVIASDIDGRAIQTAQLRQANRNMTNIEFVRAPADKAATRFAAGCDAVVVDPPRKGCAEAIKAIVSVEPKSILYFSCDPATLARDVRELYKHGYTLERAIPLDMFPQTFHVETLALLTTK